MTVQTGHASDDPDRTIVVWVPDWPIHAHRLEREAEQRLAPQDASAPRPLDHSAPCAEEVSGAGTLAAPIALISGHRVVACSAAARASGVRVGIREREASRLCPGIELHPHHPETDDRRFAPVLAAIERLVPGTQQIRPGICSLRARGPARYYGTEQAAAEALLELVHELGFPEARVGIADGRFAAAQAARAGSAVSAVSSPSDGVRIVPRSASARFLSALPVSRAAPPDLAEVLLGLGIRTLGDFAALPEESVRQRFGPAGVDAHRLAGARPTALDHAPLPTAPREIVLSLDFEPPLSSTDQLAFASSAASERFITELLAETLVCTEVRIELIDDVGVRYERTWAHPGRFTASDLINRIRWQASGLHSSTERAGAGIAALRVAPERVERTAAHEPGLWSSEPDERVHHHITRLQNLVGHDGAVIGSLTGGRLSSERQRFSPWGTRAPRTAHRSLGAGPWPSGLAAADAPSRVFPNPIPADLRDASGNPVLLDDDLLSSDPASLRVDGHGAAHRVLAWSAPWPVRERWWNASVERFRVQLVLDDGSAWLLHRTGRVQHGPQATQSAESGAAPGGRPASGAGNAADSDGISAEPPAWFAEGQYD